LERAAEVVDFADRPRSVDPQLAGVQCGLATAEYLWVFVKTIRGHMDDGLNVHDKNVPAGEDLNCERVAVG
jgi:hypothetical protein